MVFISKATTIIQLHERGHRSIVACCGCQGTEFRSHDYQNQEAGTFIQWSITIMS